MIEGVSSKLRGKFDHKLDPKNRVAIPAEWHPKEGGSLLLLASEHDGFFGIKALTERKVNEIEESVKNEVEMTTKQKNEFLEWLNGSCVEVTINSQGKLLIPKKMCEEAQFETQLILVGRGSFFEIWEPSTFEKKEKARKSSIAQVRSTYGFI